MKNRERRRLCGSVVAWKHGIYCYMVGNVPRDPIVHNEVSLYELVRFIHFFYISWAENGLDKMIEWFWAALLTWF